MRVARQVLTEYLTTDRIPPHNTDSRVLLEHRGSFVSLHWRESRALRGCLGEFLPRRPLVESVTEMAIAAATVEELPELQIEISALTPLYSIRPEQVQVEVHGLMIVKGQRRGLLLPHVPLTYVWDREDYLANLCLKAGL